MSTTWIVVIVIVAIVAVAVIAFAASRGRAKQQEQKRIEAQQHREVRHTAADHQRRQVLDSVDAEPARCPLVGDGRVDEPVADDVASGVAGRPNHLIDELSAGGVEQQQLGARRELQGPILDQVADPLARRRSTGLPQQQRARPERLGKAPRLGGLAGAVDPLEGDEHRRPLG